jgi:radical SAM protein with 4Fe4S-binding SPASM domain
MARREAAEVHISWDERERIAKRNRALLDEELLAKRLAFESGPYEAHVQFSNFCNMSCIMCWDGENPPLKRMDRAVLEKTRTQIAPFLSVITPHSASEPLVASWDDTLAFVNDYSVQLALTTNTQFLDEEKLEQVADHVEMVVMSIDSHLPEVFEKIRPGGKSEEVFANLPVAARFCESRGIECMVQVVFMTPNAASMPETVAYMADAGVQSVNVIQMIDTNGRSGHLDATLHFSSEYLERVRQQCVEVARRKHIRLGWDLDGPSWVDFREPMRKIRPRRSKAWNDLFDKRMSYRHPGFCKYAYDRLQIELDGKVEPCGLATEGELILGNLAHQDFDEIWNGPTARDLRRAHYTWDYPSICASCRYVDKPAARPELPFAANQDTFLQRTTSRPVEATLTVHTPEHMARLEDPPVFRFGRPGQDVSRYLLLLSRGSGGDRVEQVKLGRARREGDAFEIALPADVWETLETNVGWWWVLYAISGDAGESHLRSGEVRCFVRHEAIPRIEGSTLRYPDQGHLSPTYLGGERQVGWQKREIPPPRPALRQKGAPNRVRHTNGKRPESQRNGVVPGEYAEIVAELAKAIRRVVPTGGRVLVVSRGDRAVARMRSRETWHFPCESDGQWVGFHPPDSNWAIEHLEERRADGAQFLAFPSTAFWWLEDYRRFAAYLDEHYAVAAEHQARYLIYDLREQVVPVASRNGSAPEALPSRANPVGSSPPSLMRRADAVLGYGGHHRTALRSIYGDEDDVFPKFAASAQGCELTDTAGRAYVDWVGGGGPVLLGYRHPAVEAAIRAQLEAGPTLTLMHPLEVEVAELLEEMIPCAEMVSFGKNGSDALAGAIRIARAATGRELILQHGVHGFHEWFACMHPGVRGIPKVLRALVEPFPYNDLDALGELFERHRGEVAAIVMEPVAFELPHEGYLRSLIELAHANGALVVFDEMVTGLRMANGGAQELYGVTPDLACFGKALANGMPLSAIVGASDYMRLLPGVAYGMTFRGETLSLAAAKAVLETLHETPVAPHVARTGAALRDGFAKACAETGVRAELRGHPSRLLFAFQNDAGITAERIESAFLSSCARKGVLTNGCLMPSLAHDEGAVARTLDAFAGANTALGETLEAGRGTIREAVTRGFGATSADGYIDSVEQQPAGLRISGWLLPADGPPDEIEAVARDGTTVGAERPHRRDLAHGYPSIPGAAAAGFDLLLPSGVFAQDGTYSFTLRARRNESEVFALDVAHMPGRTGPTVSSNGVLRL